MLLDDKRASRSDVFCIHAAISTVRAVCIASSVSSASAVSTVSCNLEMSINSVHLVHSIIMLEQVILQHMWAFESHTYNCDGQVSGQVSGLKVYFF